MPKIADSAPYARRQIVARMGRVGMLEVGGIKHPIYGVLTLFASLAEPSIAAQFVRLADMDGLGHLRLENLKEGEIVVNPGLIYKKIPMSGVIMAEHEKAMKTWKPKTLVKYEKDTSAPPVDAGIINLTKQDLS